MINKNDSQLVIRLRDGDGKAFEKLFHKYNQKLYNFCYHMLRSKHEAESMVQNVFMKIWENRHMLDESLSFNSYLYKIAKNKVYNEFRSRLNQRYYREYLVEYAETFDNTVEKEINFSEFDQLLKDLMERLPERRKQIFLLSREEGLTYREIAEKLAISENTVDTQIRKALDYFRQYVREYLFPSNAPIA